MSKRRQKGREALRREAWVALRTLARMGRAHRRQFSIGVVSALVVVGTRLAMPWPLRRVTQLWQDGPTGDPTQMLWKMGLAFFGILFLLGLADAVERLSFARFSIGVVRDLRRKVFRRLVGTDPARRRADPNDIVSRLVGDTARLKTGMRGFLVHVATNGVAFVGVVVVLFTLHVGLGTIFALAGLIMAAVTLWCARHLFDLSLSYRTKEGELAKEIGHALDRGPQAARFSRLNRSSERQEAALTRYTGVATWVTHATFGVAVMLCIVVGGQAIVAGELQAADMVVFMLYALMMRAPIVRLARQGARTGKILGTGVRMVRPLLDNPKRGDAQAIEPLEDRLELRAVTVGGGRLRKRRLEAVDLGVRAGERVVITGGAGSGKSTVLRVMSRHQRPSRGVLAWDGVAIGERGPWVLEKEVFYLPQDPSWPRLKARQLLLRGGLSPLALEDERGGLLDVVEVRRLVDRLASKPKRRYGASDLSPTEQKLLELLRCRISSASVWLLDEPVGGMSDELAAQVLRAILEEAGGRTVVMTSAVAKLPPGFDRLIELDEGRCISISEEERPQPRLVEFPTPDTCEVP